MSHDWPVSVVNPKDFNRILKIKSFWAEEVILFIFKFIIIYIKILISLISLSFKIIILSFKYI
jgi:hypothetical protein